VEGARNPLISIFLIAYLVAFGWELHASIVEKVIPKYTVLAYTAVTPSVGNANVMRLILCSMNSVYIVGFHGEKMRKKSH